MQLLPGCTVAPWQSTVWVFEPAVTLKSPLFTPLMAVPVGVRARARLPMFRRVTAIVLLVFTGTEPVKANGEGVAIAVVNPVWDVHSGVCHTPRP